MTEKPDSHLAQPQIQQAWTVFMDVVKANYPDMRNDQGQQLLADADWFALKAVAVLVNPVAPPIPNFDDDELEAIDAQRRPPD